MRTIHRNQAEIEARELSEREQAVVSVYKLADGRYEAERGTDPERGGSLMARFDCGEQRI
jgi:hypothetical protein